MFQFLFHPLKVAYVPKALYHYERNTNPNSLTMAHGERASKGMQMVFVNTLENY